MENNEIKEILLDLKREQKERDKILFDLKKGQEELFKGQEQFLHFKISSSSVLNPKNTLLNLRIQ